MNKYFLVKVEVTRTEYVAVKASDEYAAEYLASGVASGIIDPFDSESSDLVVEIGNVKIDANISECVTSIKASDIDEAHDKFSDYYDKELNESEDDEPEEYFSD